MAEMRQLGGDRMQRTKKERPRSVKASVLLMQLREDVKAMNSAISILSQKMRHLTRNEKILGRNLIVLNKKLKEFSETNSGEGASEEIKKEIEELKKQLLQANKKIEELNIVIANQSRKFVGADELKELRYIVDSINPLDLATLDQVKELIKRESEKHQKSESQQIDLG